MKHVVLTIIAERDTRFFLNIAKKLKNFGYDISFITFYEPAIKVISPEGFEVFSLHAELRKNKVKISSVDCEFEENECGVSIEDMIRHEMLTFNIKNKKKLKNKAMNYFKIMDQYINKIRADLVIQELGGFIAPLALYSACMKNNIRHAFIEPGFFKGTIGFLVDTTVFSVNSHKYYDIANKFVANYIDYYKNNKTIVVPEKDKHHFKDAKLSKILNTQNFIKLLNKIYVKYVCLQGQEYDAIMNHIIRNICMVYNRFCNNRYYSSLNFLSDKQYIYFPLHVPLDFQLTFRSPQWLNQIDLLNKICDILPKNYILITKEHPAAIGAYSYDELKKLIHRNNFEIANPLYNSFDIISMCSGVLTINSKVGAEALIQGKPVFVLGEAFYSNKSLCNVVSNIEELAAIFKKANGDKNEFFVPDKSEVNNFFASLYLQIYQGEMYVNSNANIRRIAYNIDLLIQNLRLNSKHID